MSIALIGRDLVCPLATASQSISYELARTFSLFSDKEVKIFTVVRRRWLDSRRHERARANIEHFPTYYMQARSDSLGIRDDLSLLSALNKNMAEDIEVLIDINLGFSGSLVPFVVRKPARNQIQSIKLIFTVMNRSVWLHPRVFTANPFHYDNVVVTSPLLHRKVSTFLPWRKKVHYIPPPIDVINFSPLDNKNSKLHKNNSRQATLLYIGSINPKRFALIETLRAMELLAKKIDFTFNIFTFPRYKQDPTIYRQLERKIEELGLTDKIKIHRKILTKQEKADVYRSSVLYLFPVKRVNDLADPPISILEAMACGSIVVASPILSISPLLKDSNGYVINNLEPRYLSRLIQCIVEYSGKTRIRENARKKILNNFSYASVWKKFDELIQTGTCGENNE